MCAHLSLLRMWGCHTWSTPKNLIVSHHSPHKTNSILPSGYVKIAIENGYL